MYTFLSTMSNHYICLQIPFHKEYSALIGFMCQINNSGEWKLVNLRYARIVNFVNMLQIENVNGFTFSLPQVKYMKYLVKILLTM